MKSIRWRLLFWLGFLLFGLLGAFGITAFQLTRTNRLSEIDEALALRVARVSGDVRGRLPFGRPQGPPPPGERDAPPWAKDGGPGEPRFRKGPGGLNRRMLPSWPEFQEILRRVQISEATLRLFNEADTNGFYFVVWTPDGTLLKRSTNSPANVPFPVQPGADTSVQTRSRASFREAYHFTELGECILAGRSITSVREALTRFAWLLIGSGIGVLAIGLGGGWLLANNALRPIGQIGATAARISHGNLAERISAAETESELGRLAAVLNSTFARLESAFEQQKQFTADASHELRTPLAVIISEAQSTLQRQRTEAEYRETIQVCLDTAQQMRRLTDSLMTLARFDAGQEQGQRLPIDLAERARHCANLMQSLAAENQVVIDCQLVSSQITGDPDHIDRVIINLLSNAVRFNKPGGRIQLSTLSRSGVHSITVADNGSGIAPEDLPHIFERFYRGDKSRARANGHAGLGLAICKAIVEAHGGTIEASSELGKGAVFTVSFSG